MGEILDWMLTPLLLLLPISVGITWLVAQGIANRPFDRALQERLQFLATRLQTQAPAAAAAALVALPWQPVDGSDRFYFQVRSAGGQLLAGDGALASPPGADAAPDDSVLLRDERLHDAPVRVASRRLQPTRPGAPALLLQVAETGQRRQRLATEIIQGVLLPQFAILPLAILLAWLALVRGIQPLSKLEDRIRARKPDDLSPLDLHAVPVEVAPLVASVNGLLAKLSVSIASQRRFLADAAHQLKTPLAGLRMQADLALREGASAADLKQSLKQIGRASVRATHTVNQLLSLARAEGGAGARSWQACDLAQLTIEVVQDAAPRAIAKRIDLGYDGAQPGTAGATIEGNPTLLQELVRNLVDNAINYTPSSAAQPGVITVRVLADPFGHVAMLQVEDSGPGIPTDERSLVFEPFYRVLGNEADGSGLGLPIVLEIARQHQATVQLDDARPQQRPPGMRCTVRFSSR